MHYITTAHKAELNAADMMRAWGFIVATFTTGGSEVASMAVPVVQLFR